MNKSKMASLAPKILLLALIIITIRFSAINLFAQQPQIEWHRTYNSPANTDDFAASIAIDSSGNIITFGWIFASGSNGGYVVNKYTSSGQLLWTGRYFEPTGFTIVSKKVAVDAQNNIYITGNNESIVTVKFNSLGILQWVRKYRGSGSFLSEPHDMKIDRNGFIYVTGESSEPPPSSFDYVTIKYNSNGDSLWTRKYNGPDGRTDQAQALEVDSLGNVYVTGGSQSYHDTAYYHDITTIKYNSNGNTLWVNRYAPVGIGSGIAFDISLDKFGNIYTGGFLQDNNLVERGCLIQYDLNGNINWLKVNDSIANVADKFNIKIDLFNNIYFIGNGRNYPPGNYVIIKYNSLGQQIWLRSFYPSPPFEAVFENSTVDNNGNIYMTGRAYTVKYDSAGNLKWSFINSLNDSNYVGKSIILDTSKNIYLFANLGDNIVTIKYNQLVGINPISQNLPSQYSLYNNYPNPFNPSTKIKFSIPKRSFVQLKVYDMLGRAKDEIVNIELQPSEYEVDFDGTDFASGVYFYQLVVDGSIVDTKKLMIIK